MSRRSGSKSKSRPTSTSSQASRTYVDADSGLQRVAQLTNLEQQACGPRCVLPTGRLDNHLDLALAPRAPPSAVVVFEPGQDANIDLGLSRHVGLDLVKRPAETSRANGTDPEGERRHRQGKAVDDCHRGRDRRTSDDMTVLKRWEVVR